MTVTALQLGQLARAAEVTPLMTALATALSEQMGAASDTDNPKRCAHFLAQACEESAGWTRLEENLRYTHADRVRAVFPHFADRAAGLVNNAVALGNAVYAKRFGNGDEASGDGYRFRGRGIFQVTFRDNYAAIGKLVGADLVDAPDTLLQPDFAVAAALAHWKEKGCAEFADEDDYAEVTRLINGGDNGLEFRTKLTQRAESMGL